MYPGGNPFEAQSGDPFGAPPVTGFGRPAGSGFDVGAPIGFQQPPPSKAPLNTYAALSPIFAVVIPPAGVVLGHLALPQIRRTAERGRGAAIAGLVIGYLMCVLLIGALTWWATSDTDTGSESMTIATSTPGAPTTTPPRPSTVTETAPRPPTVTQSALRPSTVTETAPAPDDSRVKVGHATVPIGTCVEIQRRSTESSDALDLFEVDCERRDGVYTVTARRGDPDQCRTVYVAVPADRSVAVCLDPY